MEDPKVSDVVRSTAKNMYELLLQLANHIDNLEKENAELKANNESNRT
jgi:hypothetical protein